MMLQLTHHQPRHPTLEDELFDHLHYLSHPDCLWDSAFYGMPTQTQDLYINAGYFATVWAIPGDPFKVLKVSHRESDACRHYLRWVHANPHPNAPKIYGIRDIDHMMFIRMDRYYPLPDTELMLPEQVPGNKVLTTGRRPKHMQGHEELCIAIRRNFKGFKFDLHANNVMQTRDGRFIITDPMSFINSEERDHDGW